MSARLIPTVARPRGPNSRFIQSSVKIFASPKKCTKDLLLCHSPACLRPSLNIIWANGPSNTSRRRGDFGEVKDTWDNLLGTRLRDPRNAAYAHTRATVRFSDVDDARYPLRRCRNSVTDSIEDCFELRPCFLQLLLISAGHLGWGKRDEKGKVHRRGRSCLCDAVCPLERRQPVRKGQRLVGARRER
jgi:hypothetical protein